MYETVYSRFTFIKLILILTTQLGGRHFNQATDAEKKIQKASLFLKV